MFIWWINLILLSCLVNLTHQNYTELYHREGDVSFIGVFMDRFGTDCALDIGRGLEEVVSAIWTVEALNKYQYLFNTTIGVTIFGVCENLSDETAFFEALEERLNANNYFGILTTPELCKKFPPLNTNIMHIQHIINADILTDATIQLLINLQWMNVNKVISDSANTLQSFREKASMEEIFIHNEFLMNSRENACESASSKRTSSVAVVIASFDYISNLSRKICEENVTLILTPPDFVFNVNALDLLQVTQTIVSLPAMQDEVVLSAYIKNISRQKDFFTQKPPTKGLIFIETAASILKFLKPIKAKLEKHCKNSDFYPNQGCWPTADFMNEVLSDKTRLLIQKSMQILPDDVEETLKVLKIESSPNDEMFLYVTSVIKANTSEDFALFKIFNLKTKKFQPVLIMINDDLLANVFERKIYYFDKTLKFEKTQSPSYLKNPVSKKWEGHSEGGTETHNAENNITFMKGCGHQGGENLCANSTAATQTNNTTETDPKVSWRFLTWVFINSALGFVGVTCTFSIMLFIIIRLCKKDMLEDSPSFTLLLLVSVTFVYFSSLPFHLEFFPEIEFICGYRINGPPAVFAVLFSLLLSRSLLIAVCENGEEYTTHINVYLQSVLCFFMIGVQISLISQNWIFSNGSHCADLGNNYKIIFTLGYDFLLLILLVCVSPFIIRSKRNYKEGLLFSISVFFITVVWSAWISFYVLLPTEHKDAAIAIGLNSTASVLLFCIFIPQTYFMAAPFSRNRALRSLSSLDGNILSEVSNTNFRSHRALNENAFGMTYKNCEMGLSNPNFFTNRSNDSIDNRVDNFNKESVIDVATETSPN